jgi:5'-deoxynucleotidase YfbR-like HD superfamily hydrolase
MTQNRAWQRMLSGRRLDLLDPTAIDIEVEDIAHGLAFVARWNGQTIGEFPYSVAEHSLLVEEIFTRLNPKAKPAQRLIALLHDAPEYVIGDMISPVKASVGPGYDELEKRLAAAIHMRFGLSTIIPAALKKQIKKADKVSAWLEATQLAGFSKLEADKLFGKVNEKIIRELKVVLRPPVEARQAFMRQHANLLSKT